MSNVFEERIKSEGKGEEIVWYTEKSLEGDRFKIREHLVDYVPIKADATYCLDESVKRPVESTASPAGKIKFISQPKPQAQEPSPLPQTTEQGFISQETAAKISVEDTTVVNQSSTGTVLPGTVVHGKEVVVTREQQVQKEIAGDSEITRKIQDTKTIEQEHKLATTERKVFGVKPKEAITPPKFTRKIQPCRVNEREKATFECEFFGKPDVQVTWYRESYEIQSSDDFKVRVY